MVTASADTDGALRGGAERGHHVAGDEALVSHLDRREVAVGLGHDLEVEPQSPGRPRGRSLEPVHAVALPDVAGPQGEIGPSRVEYDCARGNIGRKTIVAAIGAPVRY